MKTATTVEPSKILTVSVAAYNVERYIEECLAPFCQEGVFNRVEVLVIDDGGTDKTSELAEKYQNQYPDTFTVIHKQNGGWGSTVNMAIDRAKGKYFKQLDGDDTFNGDNLKPFLDELEAIDADIVLTPFMSFRADTGETIDVSDPMKSFSTAERQVYKLEDLLPNVSIAMHQCTYRTQMLRENNIQLLEHAFYTDVELVVKTLIYSSTVSFLPYIIYCYRTEREGQSTSLEGERKHYREHEAVVLRLAAFLYQTNNVPGKRLAIKRVTDMAINQYQFYTHLIPTWKHQRELMHYDSMLKNFPEFYNINYRMVQRLRKTCFMTYFPLCWKKQRKY